MRITAFVLTSIFASFSFAAGNTFKLDMEVTMKNETSRPQIIVKEGEKASITTNNGKDEQFIEVVATETTMKNKKGILMKFVVGLIGKDGKRTILSQPQIFTLENEKASITSQDRDKSAVNISITAQKNVM